MALKVLKPELAAVLGAERFVVETRPTAALQHPHILPLFDSRAADGFSATSCVHRRSNAGDRLFYVAGGSMMAVGVSSASSFVAEALRALFPTSGLRPEFEVGADGRFLMIPLATSSAPADGAGDAGALDGPAAEMTILHA